MIYNFIYKHFLQCGERLKNMRPNFLLLWNVKKKKICGIVFVSECST